MSTKKPIPPDKPEPVEKKEPGAANKIEKTTVEEPYEGEEGADSWIEIKLLDEAGAPVPHERYKLELPGGKFLRITAEQVSVSAEDRIPPAQCGHRVHYC